MIYQYDLIRDEKLKPSLYPVKEIVKDEKEQYDAYDTVILLNEIYNMNHCVAEHNFVVAYSDLGTILGIYCMSIGDYQSCNVYNREMSMFLALTGAVSFRLYHNHPNNQLIVSDEDKGVAATLEIIGNTLGIEFKGSYIVGRSCWKKTTDDPIIIRFYDMDILEEE